MTTKNKYNGKNDKAFNPNFGFWPAKSGKGYTVAVDAKLAAMLATAEPGARLYLQEVPEEQREANEKVPSFRVTIFPAEKSEDKSDSSL